MDGRPNGGPSGGRPGRAYRGVVGGGVVLLVQRIVGRALGAAACREGCCLARELSHRLVAGAKRGRACPRLRGRVRHLHHRCDHLLLIPHLHERGHHRSERQVWRARRRHMSATRLAPWHVARGRRPGIVGRARFPPLFARALSELE